jgi:hypothetical protein
MIAGLPVRTTASASARPPAVVFVISLPVIIRRCDDLPDVFNFLIINRSEAVVSLHCDLSSEQFLPPLSPLLRLDAQGCRRAREQSGKADGFTCLLAIAVAAILDALESGFDLRQ